MLKVYCGCTFINGKQVKAIIATTSQKRVAEIIQEPLSRIRGYWSITGNENQIRIANSKPHTLFHTSMNDWENNYVEGS